MKMIQRLKDLLQASPGAVLDDWFELEARGYTYVVTFDTALFVKRAIERYPQPEWVDFTDLFGATHSVRAQDVFRISESKVMNAAGLARLTGRAAPGRPACGASPRA